MLIDGTSYFPKSAGKRIKHNASNESLELRVGLRDAHTALAQTKIQNDALENERHRSQKQVQALE